MRARLASLTFVVTYAEIDDPTIADEIVDAFPTGFAGIAAFRSVGAAFVAAVSLWALMTSGFNQGTDADNHTRHDYGGHDSANVSIQWTLRSTMQPSAATRTSIKART